METSTDESKVVVTGNCKVQCKYLWHTQRGKQFSVLNSACWHGEENPGIREQVTEEVVPDLTKRTSNQWLCTKHVRRHPPRYHVGWSTPWWPEEELSGSGLFPLCRTCLLSPRSRVAGFANCLVCPCAPQPSQWPVPVNERMVVPNHFRNNGDYRIPPFVIKDNKRFISWVVTSLSERASVSLFWTTGESCHKRRGNIPLAVLQTGDIYEDKCVYLEAGSEPRVEGSLIQWWSTSKCFPWTPRLDYKESSIRVHMECHTILILMINLWVPSSVSRYLS